MEQSYKYDVAFSFLEKDEGVIVGINQLVEARITTFFYSKNAFNKMIDKGQLDLNCLVPLLDVMIPDPDKKVDEADG